MASRLFISSAAHTIGRCEGKESIDSGLVLEETVLIHI